MWTISGTSYRPPQTQRDELAYAKADLRRSVRA